MEALLLPCRLAATPDFQAQADVMAARQKQLDSTRAYRNPAATRPWLGAFLLAILVFASSLVSAGLWLAFRNTHVASHPQEPGRSTVKLPGVVHSEAAWLSSAHVHVKHPDPVISIGQDGQTYATQSQPQNFNITESVPTASSAPISPRATVDVAGGSLRADAQAEAAGAVLPDEAAVPSDVEMVDAAAEHTTADEGAWSSSLYKAVLQQHQCATLCDVTPISQTGSASTSTPATIAEYAEEWRTTDQAAAPAQSGSDGADTHCSNGTCVLARPSDQANTHSASMGVLGALCMPFASAIVQQIQRAASVMSPSAAVLLDFAVDPPVFLRPVLKLSAAVFLAVLCGVIAVQCWPLAATEYDGETSSCDEGEASFASLHEESWDMTNIVDGSSDKVDSLPPLYAAVFASPAAALSANSGGTQISPPQLADAESVCSEISQAPRDAAGPVASSPTGMPNCPEECPKVNGGGAAAVDTAPVLSPEQPFQLTVQRALHVAFLKLGRAQDVVLIRWPYHVAIVLLVMATGECAAHTTHQQRGLQAPRRRPDHTLALQQALDGRKQLMAQVELLRVRPCQMLILCACVRED